MKKPEKEQFWALVGLLLWTFGVLAATAVVIYLLGHFVFKSW